MNKEKEINKSKIHYRGKFIVIDGCEGAGKTTMIKSLVESLPNKKIIVTHEPGGTPFADKIRELVLSSDASKSPAEVIFGLVWAARAEHLKNKVIPALKSGITVITDRFDSSTFAYQISAQKAPHLEKLFWQVREVYLKDAKPDLYVFFDVDPKIGLERVAKRKERKTHFDNRELEYHKRVRTGFKTFFKKVPNKTINASRTLEEVQKDFVNIMKKNV